jgi:hypothetical protein
LWLRVVAPVVDRNRLKKVVVVVVLVVLELAQD